MFHTQKMVYLSGITEVIDPIYISKKGSALLSPTIPVFARGISRRLFIDTFFNVIAGESLPEITLVALLQPSFSGANHTRFFSAILGFPSASGCRIHDGRCGVG